MTLTLSDVLQAVYFELGQLNHAKATGGSTSTVVVGSLAGEGSNDDWKNCALFVVRDAGGASAAPEGEFSNVSSYTDGTGTFNLEDTLTAAVASGDSVAYSTPRYSLQQSIAAINHALTNFGDMILIDQSTLQIVEEQTEYDCPVAWKFSGPPMRIDIESDHNDANDQKWIEIKDWEYEPATVSTAGKIIFARQYDADNYCRVWYKGPHPVVSDYDDVIHEHIHPDVIKWASVVELLKWMNERTQGEERGIVQNLNDSRAEFENALRRHPLPGTGRRGKLFIW